MANIKRGTVQLQLVLISMALAGAAATTTTTHLRFYMHDTVTASPGSPATAVPVARGTTPLPGDPTTRFGDMYVVDDPLTEGPGAASPAVERAQGFYLFAAQHEVAVMNCLTMVFTAGRHNGSYVVVQGRDAVPDKVRELPVVGGAGRFRGDRVPAAAVLPSSGPSNVLPLATRATVAGVPWEGALIGTPASESTAWRTC
ncbi:hypothetical protein C2845_PM17G06280 [Panicum miliaceum]|uniref:Dirigent protein n=1 Tax=Panicum miliaceum TaxID=4540 RepID=A0A3L6Q384_PANMI|nr:hypothetical protein C2845_PM17G06280 [Panicum miliaceum]